MFFCVYPQHCCNTIHLYKLVFPILSYDLKFQCNKNNKPVLSTFVFVESDKRKHHFCQTYIYTYLWGLLAIHWKAFATSCIGSEVLVTRQCPPILARQHGCMSLSPPSSLPPYLLLKFTYEFCFFKSSSEHYVCSTPIIIAGFPVFLRLLKINWFAAKTSAKAICIFPKLFQASVA